MNTYDEQEETGADFFDTPEISVPESKPDAHRAIITGVSARQLNNDKQTDIISIAVTSQDVPSLDGSYDIFLPKGFVDNIALGSKFDPNTLPEMEGNKQQTSFRLGIANSEKTATLQQLIFNQDSVARKAGRDPKELWKKVETLEDYVSNINAMLNGLECIMLRRERGGDDPAFRHQLQVRQLLSADEADVNPKRFRKYQKAWEQN